MPLLILLRHGQSQWNLQNRFTGWVDIPLSEKEIAEAIAAGQKIKDLPIDQIFVSSLIRSQMTAMIAMAFHHSGKAPCIIHNEQQRLGRFFNRSEPQVADETIPVTVAWQLNERHYGKLQGLNKQTTCQQYGAEQVHRWRRSYSIAPPEGESLKDTSERTSTYWDQAIEPALQSGRNVLVCAHGNSLRSILMRLESLSEQQVAELEIPTGEPLIYRCQDRSSALALEYKRLF